MSLPEFSKAQYWEQALEGLLDLFPAAVWACDSHLHFVHAHGDCEGVLGSDPESLPGKGWFEFSGTDDPSFRLNSEMLRALAGESVSFEWEWRKRSLVWSFRPLYGEEDGAIRGIAGLAVDLSIQRLLSERLLASEQRYRDLFEHAAGMAFTCDLEGKLLTVNRAMGDLLAVKSVSLIGQCLFDLIVPEERLGALEAFRSHFGGSTQQRVRVTFLKGKSARIPVEINTRLLFDAGLPSTIQGVAVQPKATVDGEGQAG